MALTECVRVCCGDTRRDHRVRARARPCQYDRVIGPRAGSFVRWWCVAFDHLSIQTQTPSRPLHQVPLLRGPWHAQLLRSLRLNFVGRAVPKASMPELNGVSSGRLELEAVATHNTIVGGEVYPMAASLAHYLSMHHRASLALGPATLELGAGTGAVGLYAAALGARVTLSDKNIARAALQPQSYGGAGDVEVITGTSSIIIDLLRRNASANAARCQHQPQVRTIDWSDDSDVASAHATSPDGAGFSLILGSDITYAKGSHESLAKAIVKLLSPTRAGFAPSVALIAHDSRRVDLWGVDVQLRSFEDAALACGLQVQRSHLRFEETGSDGYLLRLVLGWCGDTDAVPALG